LRVLMVTPRFPPDVGGVEGHVYEVARRLILRGVEVTVLTTDRSRRLPHEDALEGIRIRRIEAWPRRRDYYLAPSIPREIGRSGCDVLHLHSHLTFVGPLAMAAAVRRHLPFVVTFHGIGHSTRLRGPLRPMQLIMLRPLLARAARLIALNDSERDRFGQLLRLPIQRFAVIPNGGDRLLAAEESIENETQRGGDSPVIASIGRLEHFKGHHRLVAALPLVLKRYPGTQLRIVGMGPEEGALRQLAARLGVTEHVEITAIPITDRTEMATLLRRADIVALLSNHEAQPLAMLEAAALGRQLLVTEAPGLRQLVEGGVAAGVPLNASTNEVAEALMFQLTQPSIPSTATIPTWDACVDRLLDVYASVPKNGGPDRDVASGRDRSLGDR
jgi:glycogen synthase